MKKLMLFIILVILNVSLESKNLFGYEKVMIKDSLKKLWIADDNYHNWLNFMHQPIENFDSVTSLKSFVNSWVSYNSKLVNSNVSRYQKVYSLDSSYFSYIDKYPFEDHYHGTFPPMLVNVQIVNSKDSMALTLLDCLGPGFITTIIWRSESKFEICGYKVLPKYKDAVDYSNYVLMFPTIWRYDLSKNTFQEWESKRPINGEEIKVIKKRWCFQKMHYKRIDELEAERSGYMIGLK